MMPALDTGLTVLVGMTLFAAFVNGALGLAIVVDSYLLYVLFATRRPSVLREQPP
jgi:hypothetical protein